MLNTHSPLKNPSFKNWISTTSGQPRTVVGMRGDTHDPSRLRLNHNSDYPNSVS
jgi:hypothetical protein